MEPAFRRPLAGLTVGVALTLLGPGVGWLATVLSLRRAFDAVGSVDPSSKATTLSQGISGAMGATAVGLGVGILGVLISLVALLFLLRSASGKAADRRG